MKDLNKSLSIWAQKPFTKQLKRQFPTAEIFLVGGAVRDALLSRPTVDFDLVVRNVPKNSLEKFLSRHGQVSLVGKRFGVFKFKPKDWTGGTIDIALPRTEHSIKLSGAYKDFKISSNANLKIEDDLSRRDFTINAMAFNVVTGALIDPFNGQVDLKKKIIRTVGSAEKRFAEDYSRMLRAIRFACQLNFTTEPKTFSAVKKLAGRITKKASGQQIVPNEVIAKELVKAIGYNPTLALAELDRTGLLKTLMPELLKMKGCKQPPNWHSEGDVWVHTMLALKTLQSKKFKTEFAGKIPTAEATFALLFHDLGKPYTMTKTDRIRFHGHDVMSAQKFRVIAERLKLSAGGLNVESTEKVIAKHMLLANPKLNEIKNVTLEKYFFNSDFPGQELLMVTFCDIAASVTPSGKANFSNYTILKTKLKKLSRTANPEKLVKPLVNGHDLIKALKLKPGPKIGALLSLAREAQLAGKIKTKSEGLTFVKKHL